MPNDLRSELNELIKERDDLEAEAEVIKSFLTSPGPNNEAPPGLRGVPLVDDEGFPRSDIDVWDVRVKRNRLACIETDHAALMKRIEDLVQQLHQEAKAKGAFRSSSSSIPPQARTEGRQPSLPTTASSSSSPMEVQQHKEEQAGGSLKHPFALIDQVFRASPAEEAGLKEGDLLVEFGSVDAENHSNLTAVVQVVQNSVGRPIRVVVLRKEGGGGGVGGKKQLVVSLTPHTWSGRGLLGCHLSALSP